VILLFFDVTRHDATNITAPLQFFLFYHHLFTLIIYTMALQSTLKFAAAEAFLPSLSQSTALPEPVAMDVYHNPSSTQPSVPSSVTSDISSKSHFKPRTGWYFKHMPHPDPETRYYTAEDCGQHSTRNLVWKCKYCPDYVGKTYKLVGGNQCIITHLKAHGITKDSPRQERAKRQQSVINLAQKDAQIYPQKRRRLDEIPGESVNPDTLEILYTQFITACNEPLRLVECPEFRAFLYYLNQEVDNWLPQSHNTVREWVLRQFKIKKDAQIQRLQSSLSDTHIMVDLWSSPNQLPVLGITAVYVCEDGKMEKSVLALKVVEGAHDGENLSKYVMDVISEWGIASKLGYFNMDNAPNNDTMLKAISLSTFLCVLHVRKLNFSRSCNRLYYQI
jgi:hypothetical protein